MNWSPDHWSALADIIVAGSVSAAAIAAFQGLHTWRNQSIWVADNELARKLLVAVYKFRDSLYSIRHPVMFNAEMSLEPSDSQGLSESEQQKKRIVVAYARKWERHLPAESELNALLIETDAVWGNTLSQKVAPLKELQHELYGYVSLHLDAHFRRDAELASQYRTMISKRRDILYDTMTEEDEFRKDFSRRLIPIESHLRSKLGRTP